MKLRTSHLVLIALLGGGGGAWYGVQTAARGGEAFSSMVRGTRSRAVWASFCHAPPEIALEKVEPYVKQQDAAPNPNPVVARYPRVALAMLNERLGRAEAANAQWGEVLRGCEGERCKRELWRDQVQKGCDP